MIGGVVLNVPNAITLTRLGLAAPVCVMLLTWPHDGAHLAVATAIACGSAALDKVDGYVARRYGQETYFGRLWDPIVDKLWLYALLLSLLKVGAASFAATGLFLSRDLIVTGLRESAVSDGRILSARYVGKLKFRFQAAYTVACIGALAVEAGWPRFTAQVSAISQGCLWLAVVFTVLSWVSYLAAFSPPSRPGPEGSATNAP